MRTKNISAIIATAVFFFSCATSKTATGTKEVVHSYETSYDRGKVLKGVLTRADIESDTAFKWFDGNMKLGKADAFAVDAFHKHAADIKMVIFGGTWCEDTQNLLPQFYRLADKSGFPDSSITLLGVDRAKTTVGNLHKAFDIHKVPTFIIMKDGKEMGRVVEYGKYGQIDKELGEIVNGINWQ
jgi:thiol-disulfide isomerase/thioredoxin